MTPEQCNTGTFAGVLEQLVKYDKLAYFVVDEAHRLPQLNAVRIPDGVDDAATRKALLERFNLEIGGGLGAAVGEIVLVVGIGCRMDVPSRNRCLCPWGSVSAAHDS